MPQAAKKEYTPEELDALETQQAQRPVYDVISGGVGAAISYYDGPQETKAEYTPEELDVRDALYSAPELTPEELDQRTVDAKYDARVLLSPGQLKEADELEAKLTEQGKRPGKWQTAKAIGGGILQSVADWNMALDKTGNLAAVVENVLIKTGAISGDYKKIPAVEAALQAPASAKAAVPAVALNTMETVLALNNLMKGKPRYRVQETGEFVYAPLGGVAPLTQLAGEGKTLVPVTDADLDEHRYQLYAKENAIRSTYLDIMDEKLLGVKPNQSFTLPAEILLAPENLAPGLAASRVTGAARLGKLFSAKTLGAAEAAAGGSANVIDKGADVFTRAVQKMTFGLADRKTQSKIAKAAAYGGGAGAAATMLSGAPEEARNTALALMSLYPMYKMGSGVLRRVEGAAGTAKMIMRESADATNGMDDVARAAVANNAAVPREIREALANPSKFVPLESTPARIAKNEAFSPRVREVAARLASPLIVQASRTAGAVARGAVVGPVANIPFAEAYREMGDQQTAEGIYGAGVLFGAGGGLVGRVAGARGRRRDAAISDIGRMLVDIQQNNAGELGRPAPNRAAEVYYSMKEPGRMLTDVELAGGDIEALLRNTKFEDLAGMAAMQGFYRDSVDFIPLNGLDYDANVKALGGNGTAGYYLHAPEGQRARLFLNADARRTDVAPHEYGHALLASAAISPEMKNSARASINQRYGPEKLDAMAREYARSVVAGRNAREFPGQKIDVSETEVGSILNELTENGLARGDADRLDWLRDEIFAEEHRAAGIDYAQIRRGIPAGFNPVGFAENVLGANARALAAAGAPIDPQTGKLQAPPDRLFKDNPILAADPVMRRNIRQYVSAYQQWLNDPAHEAPVGAPLSRTGNPNDLKNNPNVTFRDYGNGRLENELAFIDQDGNVKLKDKKNDPDRAKFIRARQQQVREMIDRGTKEPTDPTFGIRFRDGQRIVAGKTLPPRFDLTRFPAPLKQLARRMETIGNAGETMQVRYFAYGKSRDLFKQGNVRDARAINREVMFVEWQATKDGNINAFVVDLTQFRNRAMKAIAQRDPALAKVNWDFKQLEADLRRVLDNHANGRDGSDGIGPERRNAVNALLGIGTKTNRAANPLTGLGGKGSALKTLRLDAFDDIAGTGRQGFSFDYQKANGNFMPDRPAPRPDLDSDLPVRMPQQIPREAQGMPDAVASGRVTEVKDQPPADSPKYRYTAPTSDRRAWQKAQTGQPVTLLAWRSDNPSGQQLTSYAKERIGRDTLWSEGWYGARDPDIVRSTYGGSKGMRQYEVSLENPFVVESDSKDVALGFSNEDIAGIRAAGHDGIVVKPSTPEIGRHDRNGIEVVVFDKPQATPSAAPRGQAMPDAVQSMTTDQLLRQYEENQGYLGLSTLGMREGRPVAGGAAQTRELLRRNEAINAELERRGVRQEDPQLQRALQRRGQAMPDVSPEDAAYMASIERADLERYPIGGYHGGPRGIEQFKPSTPWGKKKFSKDGVIYTAFDRSGAEYYADLSEDGRVYEVYARADNPFYTNDESLLLEPTAEDVRRLKKLGHDAIFPGNTGQTMRAFFYPEQVVTKESARGAQVEALAALNKAAEAAGYVRVIRTIPKEYKARPVKRGDWVSLDTPEGREYQREYAASNVGDEMWNYEKDNHVVSAYVHQSALSEQGTGWKKGQTLTVLEDAPAWAIKSGNLIVRNAAGKIVPPSKRFGRSTARRGQAMPDAVHGDNRPLPAQVPDRGFYIIGTKPTADGRVLEYHLDPATTIQPRVADIESIRGEQVAMLEADRHNTRGDNMGGPLHPFLISNQTVVRLPDGRGFKAVWANMNSAFVTRAKNIVKNTTAGHALIQIMKENAHRSNRKFVMDVTSEIDARRPNMTTEQSDFLHVLLELGAINPQGRINQAYSRVKRASDAALEGQATMSEVAEAQRAYDQTFNKYQPMVEFLNRLSPLKSHATRGRMKEFAGEFASVISKHGSSPWYSSMASKYRNTKFVDEAARFSFKQRGAAMDRITGIPFAPDVKAMLQNSMDFVNGQNLDVVGVVQLSKDTDTFAVYFGKNPKEEAKMSANERMLRDQFLTSGTFKPHPSYDWVMLGPENADSFVLDAPADPLKLFPDYAKSHPNPKVKKGSKETVVGTMKKSKIPLILK